MVLLAIVAADRHALDERHQPIRGDGHDQFPATPLTGF